MDAKKNYNSLGRLANHAGQRDNNCKLTIINSILFLKATKMITLGEEITYDYNCPTNQFVDNVGFWIWGKY